MKSEELEAHHLVALEKCTAEFERLTRLDIDLNNEYESLLNDVNGVYSCYVISNQANRSNKQNKLQLSTQWMFDLLKSGLSSEKTINLGALKNPFNFKDSLSKPVDLVQSTIFVSCLVFFLISAYVMLFHEFLSKLNIQYSTIFNYFCLLAKYVSIQFLGIFNDFLGFCYFTLSNLRNGLTQSSASNSFSKKSVSRS
jgi:hypothetical protein